MNHRIVSFSWGPARVTFASALCRDAAMRTAQRNIHTVYNIQHQINDRARDKFRFPWICCVFFLFHLIFWLVCGVCWCMRMSVVYIILYCIYPIGIVCALVSVVTAHIHTVVHTIQTPDRATMNNQMLCEDVFGENLNELTHARHSHKYTPNESNAHSYNGSGDESEVAVCQYTLYVYESYTNYSRRWLLLL